MKNTPVLNRKIVFNGYNKIEKLSIKTKKSKIIERELLKNKDGVCAIIYDTKKDKYLVVEQWRPSLNGMMKELIAGSIEINETPLESVEKEVLEETGYECDYIQYINSFYVSPGTISEKVYLYYVEVSNQISNIIGCQEEDEELDLIELSYDELCDTLFIDAKSIIGVNWLKSFQKKLSII